MLYAKAFLYLEDLAHLFQLRITRLKLVKGPSARALASLEDLVDVYAAHFRIEVVQFLRFWRVEGFGQFYA